MGAAGQHHAGRLRTHEPAAGEAVGQLPQLGEPLAQSLGPHKVPGRPAGAAEPGVESRNDLYSVKRDTAHLKDVAGVKGAIEGVRDAWLPFFQQHVANQRVSVLC